uniref:Transmembrane protein n=1 Tax=Parascaris univalens TaxID=6257 RepID=A0A914ZLS0_PARUN
MLVRRSLLRVADCLRAQRNAVKSLLYVSAVFDSSCLLSSLAILMASPRPLLYAASICTSSVAVLIAYILLFIRSEMRQDYRSEFAEDFCYDESILPFMMYLGMAKLLLTLFSVAAFMWTNWMIPLEGLERFKRFVMGLQWSAAIISFISLIICV